MILAALFWVRGIPFSFKERISIAKKRFKGVYAISLPILFIAFIGLGTSIYLETGTKSKRTSSKERELRSVEWEKKYKKFENYAQPRFVAVNANVNLYPKKRFYDASAKFTLVNKTNQEIDSLFLNHNSLKSTFTFNKPNKLVSEDTIHNFDIYVFENKIMPGDTLQLDVTVEGNKNTNYRRRSSR